MSFYSFPTHITQLFALVRLACGGEVEPCLTEEAVDWEKVYDVAYKQAVLGICLAGIERLGDIVPQSAMPEIQLLMKWTAMGEKIREENDELNRKAVEVTRFFTENGIRTAIIKGQSNYAVYPKELAELRTPGDIDIWADGDRKELIRFAENHWKTSNLQFQHIECRFYDSPDVELHFWPTTLFNYRCDRRLKAIFNEEREKCFDNHFDLLPDGTINCLTPRANVMMQVAHIYHHLMVEGIGLKQLLDYYMLLDSIEDDGLRSRLKKDVEDCGLKKFASALSWIMGEVFHLDESKIIIAPDENEGRFLLKEVLAAGNMGQHDKRYKNTRKDHFTHFFYSIYQNMRLVGHYPSDIFWNIIYKVSQNVWLLTVKV